MKKQILLFSLLFFCLSLQSQVKSTHVYSVQENDSLKLDVYIPENIPMNHTLPVLVWMHGGGFAGGSRDYPSEVQLCEYAANHGYVAVSISYRLTRKGEQTGFSCQCPKSEKLATFHTAIIDYLDACQFLQTHASEFHIDTNFMVAGGSSAGAEAVLNAVYLKDYFLESKQQYQNIQFKAVIGLAGAVVDAQYIDEQNVLPTVLFHGAEDPLVPIGHAPHHYCTQEDPGYILLDGSDEIVAQIEKANQSYYYVRAEHAKHEMSGIPFDDLEQIFQFIHDTALKNQLIQNKITR